MPLDDEVVELINAAVDGEATPHERARLETILAGSPEAQRLFEATQEIAGRLDAARREEPPISIRSAIMDEIGARADSRPGATRSPVPAHAVWSGRKMWFGLGWAAAAAVVVAIVIVDPMHLAGRHDRADSGATMAPHASYDWPVVKTIESTDSGTQLIVRRDGDLTLLEVGVTAVNRLQPLPVSLSWDPAAATAVAISGGRDASSSKGQFNFTLGPSGDRGSVVVRPNRGVGTTEVTVFVNSKQVIRAVVPLG